MVSETNENKKASDSGENVKMVNANDYDHDVGTLIKNKVNVMIAMKK